MPSYLMKKFKDFLTIILKKYLNFILENVQIKIYILVSIIRKEGKKILF